MFDHKLFRELRVHSNLNGNTGKIDVQYFWKGVEVSSVAITGAIVRRYAGLTMIQRDLQNAGRWARYAARLLDGECLSDTVAFQAIENRDVGDLIKGLFVASLSYYAKAFNSAEGRRVRLSRDMVPKDLQPQHDSFMELRNKLAAHAGSDELESVDVYLLLVPLKGAEFDFKLTTSGKQADFGHSGDPNQFYLLIEQVLQLTVDQGLEAAQRIIRAATMLPPSIWKTAAASGASVDLDNAMRNIQ